MSKSSRIIDGLKTNTAYNFWVRAKNSMGAWSVLPTVVAHTTIKDTTAPTAPAGQAILVATPNFFIIQWTLGSEKDLEEHRIYVYTSNTPASAKVIKRVSGNTTRVMVNQGEASEDASITIAAGTAYWFWITSVDQSGNESSKSTLVTGTLSATGGVYLLKSLFDANTILKADVDDTPEALTMAEQTILGRLIGGEIAALTGTQIMSILASHIVCSGDEVVCSGDEVVYI